MNRYVALGCLGLGLMVSPLLGSIGNSAVPASPKIGVIDMGETLQTTPAGKRAREAYEKGRKAKQTLLDKQQEDIKKAQEDLIKQKPLLKPEMFESRRQELEKKFVELQQTFVKLDRELNEENAKMLKDLFDQAQPKITMIAKAEGITLVLDKQFVLYADPTSDLTQKLNAEMK